MAASEMPGAPTPISARSLARLHPRAISDAARVRALLQELRRRDAPLWRATNRHSERELAHVLRVTADELVLRTAHFEAHGRPQVFLNFELDGHPYFFSAPRLAVPAADELVLALPAVVYQAERRDRPRRAAAAPGGRPGEVALRGAAGIVGRAEVVDVSPGGIALRLPGRPPAPGARVELRGEPVALLGDRVFAEVRNAAPEPQRPGWTRIGLLLGPAPWGAPLPVERRERILDATPRAARPAPVARVGQPAQPPASDVQPHVVRYANARGEELRAIVDRSGPSRSAPAVLIPAAWGRTKETLLPLARTIVATFEAAGQPVTVIRFDGVGRRGESHRDPACRSAGSENLRFTFSQGARDIAATLDFLERTPDFEPSTAILVTFSVASIEGRRAMAEDARGRLGGWVSVVGAADAQSLTRIISGGVDYFGGVERGLHFGLQEIQGLLVDMDHAGRDAIEQRLAFLDDARRDFARIEAPITWIHGRHDAWMDLERVRHALAFGQAANRRLIEVPTGHQLRTSREALETFQLIASEVGRMALGRALPVAAPDPGDLAGRRDAERARLARTQVDLRGFWHDYLVGREGGVGMELVTNTRPYQQLMELQVRALALHPGDRVLDLGSGVGAFPLQLLADPGTPRPLHVTQADVVRDALRRSRSLLAREPGAGLDVSFVQLDLDLRSPVRAIPLRSASYDAILASLLLNYVTEPKGLLDEAFRLLRPGGRLVLSSLRRDADISTICVDAVSELRAGRGREAFGAEGERQLGASLQHFINDAARLLDLEERGLFHFWDAPELGEMLLGAGFQQVRVQPAFGWPQQAFVAGAVRP